MDEKMKTWTLRFPAKENPNMEKALFDWPIVLQYDVKTNYRLFTRKFSGTKFFKSPGRSLNQPKATRVCIRPINQSNRTIFVRLLFLFCSRAFISRSYENRSKVAPCERKRPNFRIFSRSKIRPVQCQRRLRKQWYSTAWRLEPRPTCSRDFKIHQRGRQRERKKKNNNNNNNRFNRQNINFARPLPLFVDFLARFCATTTWKCLILRFMEDVNRQRRNIIFLSEFGYGSQEFSFRRVHLHLIK